MEERQDLISRQVAIDALRDAENHAFNSFYKGLAKAHKIIADLPSAQPEPHWIPCSERLPKKTGYYLTTNEYKVVHEDYYWGSGCFEKAKKYQCEVVAWMPMPIPPYCGVIENE